jgi:hypothetical protein
LFFLALFAYFAVKSDRLTSITANSPAALSLNHQQEMRFTGPAEFNPFVDFVIIVVNRIGVWQHGVRLGPISETQPARPGNERVAVITSGRT